MNRRPAFRGVRQRVRRPGPSATSFVPTSLSGCTLWLRADLGITQATGVSAWADQSGNGRNFTQGTGGNQPAYSATLLNGLPGLTFDGTDDVLTSTATVADVFTDAAYTYLLVCQWVTIGTNTTTYDNDPMLADSGGYLGYHASSGTPTAMGYHFDSDGGAGKHADKTVALTTNYVVSVVYNGTNISHALNGGAATTATALSISTTTGSLRLGRNYGTAYANIKLHEVICFNRAVTAGELSTLVAYCQSFWGI